MVSIGAQQPVTTPAPIERRAPADPNLDAASSFIGQALFLRCFSGEDTLTFTSTGAPELRARSKVVDWTLSAIDIQKVQRRGPGELELDGVRVALKFAPDRREWERHPQKTETMRLTVAEPASGDPAAFRRTLVAIFSQGIDRALQRSMPPYWQHYFDPQAPWVPDELAGQTLYTPGKPDASGQAATAPAPTKKADVSYTAEAQQDKVRGTVGLQLVVAADGGPRRIAVIQPLGYGLDATAAEALGRYRFAPATLNGAPVAAQVRINQDFVLVPGPR